MFENRSARRESWKTIFLFLGVLSALSSMGYYAILKLNITSIYVGALMVSPAIASFITLKIRKRPIASLPWSIKDLAYLKLGYLTPLIYVSIAYAFIWILGFGELIDTERIASWGDELGLADSSRKAVVALMVFLLLTVGVVKNLGSTLGEEIGWRGFLIFELRKVMSFKALAIVSGIIWAAWHYPIIYLMYGSSELLFMHLGAFTAMIIGMSVVLAYYTFKSNSLWPAAVYHSVHNIYIQKICTPLTISNEQTPFWIDEYGWMIPCITTVFAVYFWRKASKDSVLIDRP